jgi:hypothetical protein
MIYHRKSLTGDVPQKIKDIRQEVDDKLKRANGVIAVAGNIIRDRRVQAQKDEKAFLKATRDHFKTQNNPTTVTKKLFTPINQSLYDATRTWTTRMEPCRLYGHSQ